MPELAYLKKSEFDRVCAGVICRLNTLVEVKKAGSGHLGSSFSGWI